VKSSAAVCRVKVSADGHGVVSHAGLGMLRGLADLTRVPRQRGGSSGTRCDSGCRSATVTTRTRPAACPACAPTAFATSAWAPAWPHGGSEDGGFELFDESAPSRRCSSAIRSACRATVSSSCTIRSACRRTKAAS
jgi:hypothetical protein